jgi:hypothetical protein
LEFFLSAFFFPLIAQQAAYLCFEDKKVAIGIGFLV